MEENNWYVLGAQAFSQLPPQQQQYHKYKFALEINIQGKVLYLLRVAKNFCTELSDFAP